MSVPWEVWCDEYGVFSREGVSNGSRYLRADLTCGECGLWLEKYARGSALEPIGHCQQFDDHYSAGRIGCFAFKPPIRRRK